LGELLIGAISVSVRGGGPRGSGARFNRRPNPSPGPGDRVRLQIIGMRHAACQAPPAVIGRAPIRHV
jgi:hypothetical protein